MILHQFPYDHWGYIIYKQLWNIYKNKTVTHPEPPPGFVTITSDTGNFRLTLDQIEIIMTHSMCNDFKELTAEVIIYSSLPIDWHTYT